ncbi:MAG: hypothetical protein KID00_12480 [Clostridium argentinense]|uniref:Uncharacterized protein n=1 Tax=Clostridium faecium TaxID=2762223 RepID=A0ABR8YPY1_9CLOT|nr:hypothetical protein [Clostridium faecium]MBD8046295.1 hypothetical protein [Clostridium faecium]MBS5824643.1 hypothetical protein [Clostridium argentinense]MDU1349476.1 hypothetical protein [Clostridium argentinense]
MKKVLRKTIFLALTAVIFMSNNLVYAASNENNGVNQEKKAPIVINNMQDLEEMRARDLKEYNEKMDNIPVELKNDFNNFEEILNLKRSNSLYFENEEGIELYVDQFISVYPKYAAMNEEELTSNIKLLKANIVVTAVRKFFSSNGYELALDLYKFTFIL